MARSFSARGISSSLRTLKWFLLSCGLPRPSWQRAHICSKTVLPSAPGCGTKLSFSAASSEKTSRTSSERLARRRPAHHVLVRPDGGGSFRLVGHVDARVGDRDRLATQVRLEARLPGRAGAALHLRRDLGVERIRLLAEPLRAHQRLELRAAALVERVRDRRRSGCRRIARRPGARRANCASERAVRVGSLDEPLRKPVHPGARELLHPQDALRAGPRRLMAGFAIERRAFEVVLVVDAVRGPVVLDLLGQQAREIAAAAGVAALLLEAEQIEVEIAASTDRGSPARRTARRARTRPRSSLSGRLQVGVDAREHEERGLIADTLIATSDVELPVSANARWSASPTSSQQLGDVADLGAPAAAAQRLGEAVAAAARADPIVGVLARRRAARARDPGWSPPAASTSRSAPSPRRRRARRAGTRS